MRISDWSSDVCSSDLEWLRREYPEEWILTKALERGIGIHHGNVPRAIQQYIIRAFDSGEIKIIICTTTLIEGINTVAENVIIYDRSEEHTSELQSLMRISYAVFCLKKQKIHS